MIASTRKSERAGSVSRVAGFAAAALILGAAFSGCGSDDTQTPTAGSGGSAGTGAAAGTGGGTSGATFTQVLAIFGGTANCGICHASMPNTGNGGLQFNTAMKAQAHAALVGPSSAGTNGSKCAGKKYVVPGNPAGSLLYGKLTSAPPCGVQMPMGGTPLSADQLQTVSSWIMAGALNN